MNKNHGQYVLGSIRIFVSDYKNALNNLDLILNDKDQLELLVADLENLEMKLNNFRQEVKKCIK